MKADHQLVSQYIRNHPKEAVEYLEKLEFKEIAKLLEAITPGQAAELMGLCSPYLAGRVMHSISEELAIALIGQMRLLDVTTIIRKMEERTRIRILAALDRGRADQIRRSLSYSDEQVGAFVDPGVLTLALNSTIDRAMTLVKKENLMVRNNLFVLTEEKKLAGYVELRDLLGSTSENKIRNITRACKNLALPEMNKRDLLQNWKDPSIDWPVVTVEGFFLGIVTYEVLSTSDTRQQKWDRSAIQAGNALGDLFLIGLTSLLGSSRER